MQGFAWTFNYLGYDFQPARFEVAERTTDNVTKLRNNMTETELGYFLGLCNGQKLFVENLAQISPRLSNRFRMNIKYRPPP